MTAPTGTLQTYQAIGNREDLIDLIVNISPSKTPVLSMTESAKASGVLHEWQTDALAAPTANAQIEGDDATGAALTPTVRANNYCQILRKIYIVSETQEAVAKAGRGSEEGYQAQKAMKELANDIEYAFIINTAAASGASGTARQLKGINGWVATSQSTATGNRALSTTILDALLQLVWAQGGDPDVILCGGAQKIAIAGFTANTRDISAEKKEVVNAVDIYQSSFGTLRVVLSHVMNTGLANQLFALDMSYWRKAWLRPITKTPLAKTGDSTKNMIVAEVTLESGNEKASGVVKNLS